MRTLTFNLCGYRASMALPDEFFDERGIPKWHRLNSHFAAVPLVWDKPIGGVQLDEVVVNQATEVPTITEELQQLREVITSLEKKFKEVR